MFWALIIVCVVTNTFGDSLGVGDDLQSRVVNTKQGPVRGYKSRDGDIYVFYGVPYATAPTGSQRFQAPLPPPVMLETFEAVDKGVICPQYNYLGLIEDGKKTVKENCLIANIYVPQGEQKKLPVLVYVHGGGFALGFGDFMTPKELAKSKKVIIVNFNFRLGPHGFLCLGTKDVPGNAGMKDQVALLKWIKDNIAGFGGNPDDVTIAGYSTGSSSVDLLMLSNMAIGLFNKVIPESGANTATFSVQADPIEAAKKYAKQLNFTNVNDIYALEEFYKTAPYNLLTSVNLLEAVDATLIFTTCVERDIGIERFLDDSPINILKSGNYPKLPMLYGFTKMEGMTRLNFFEAIKDMMNDKFSDFIPLDLKFRNEHEKDMVAAKIKKFYFGENPVSGNTIMGFVNYYTDILYAYSTLLSVRLQMEAGNDQIYLYEFSYAGESSPIIPYIGIHGADHCAQTMTVHDGLNATHTDESMATDDFKKMKRILREMWLNFITTSKPVPEGSSLPTWPPTGPNASPYMILDRVLVLKEIPLLEKRMRFWDDIYSKYYRQPIPPRVLSVPKIELK